MKYDLLKKHIGKLGLDLSDVQAEQFLQYEALLVSWNKHMNLTGIVESEAIYDKHFADSLTCILSDLIHDNSKVIDVGTGAGFPGIPLKIFKPDIDLTLLDSLNKRINFLEQVADDLNLEDITFLHGRAEDYGQDELYREQYDVVVSRAVADLSVLLELCTPYLKVDGYFIAHKGKKVHEELRNAENALEKLNLIVENVISVKTSDETTDHNLLIIRKTNYTDTKYPRRAGKPLKKPL